MEYKQAKRRFYSWLQKKGAYEQYKRNRHIANNSPFSWGYRSHFNSPVNFINLAFDWDNTPEGNRFWCELHEKWVRLWNGLYQYMPK